jgi:hypothetical protein
MSAIKLMSPDGDDDLSKLSNDDLLKRLAETFDLTIACLLNTAALYREAVRRKIDVPQFRAGLLAYIPLISVGTVAPEAVAAFAGYLSVLKKVTLLPVAEQKRLATGGTVEVAERKADGTFDTRALPFTAILATPDRVKLVLGDRCLRSIPEQVAVLTAPVRATHAASAMGDVRVDKRNKVVRIGKAVAPLADVVAALKAAGVSW